MSTETQVLEGDALQDYFTKEEVSTGTTEEVPTSLEEYFENPEDKPVSTTAPVVESKETKPTPVAAPVVETKTNIYSELIKEYIEDGDWEDGAIEIEDDKGETITVNLLDLKDVTPEQFKQIKAGQKALKDEDFKKKYISSEGLDENTLKLIELKKAGGDTRELFQIQAELVNPLDRLDLNDERVHEYLVRQKLSANPDLDQYDIDSKISRLKANFTLDSEAKKIIEEVNTNFGVAIEEKQREFFESREKAQEEQKAFKKQMTQTYKDLKLNENIVKNLVENTAKYDEYGLTNVDKAFFEAKKNPELFAKIAYLILDEKGFNELQGVKIKNDVTKETIKTIFKISPKTSKTNITAPDGTLENYFEQNKE
jgi:hypothetical protein